MSGFFNLGSLLFGIVSWSIPMIALKQYKKGHSITNYSIYSFTFCATALIFQMFEIKNRVNLEDWSALMDTIGAISVVSVILVVITVILNMMVNSICRTNNK